MIDVIEKIFFLLNFYKSAAAAPEKKVKSPGREKNSRTLQHSNFSYSTAERKFHVHSAAKEVKNLSMILENVLNQILSQGQ